MSFYTNKRVWVTGATSGIGKALALELDELGARVIISARREELLGELAGGMKQAKVLPLDLNEPQTLEKKAEQAQSFWGGIDIMVHNAGMGQRALAAEMPMSMIRQIMEVNFFSTVVLTKALLPKMLEEKAGQFIVISSLMGKFGGPGRCAYAASKHALHGFFESLRYEEWNNGIRATLVTPGYIKTSISQYALRSDGSEHGKIDPGQAKGMPADICAKKILSGVAAGKDELLIGGWEKWGVMLKRWAPAILSRILRGRNID